MMDPSEINNFEDEWRKALKEASEAPPQSIWEGIEARLDQQEDKGMVLPLWWQSHKLWYAAASITALLLVGGIWYSNSKMSNNSPEIAASQTKESREQAKTDLPQTEIKKEEEAAQLEQKQLAQERNANSTSENASGVAMNGKTASKTIDKTEFEIASGAASENGRQRPAISGSKGTVAAAKLAENQVANNFDGNKTKKEAFAKLDKTVVEPTAKENNNIAVSGEQVARVPETPVAATATESEMTIAALQALPYSDLDIHIQKRYVFFRPESKLEQQAEPEPPKPKEYYAGLSLMPASFNPNLKVKEAPMAFNNASFSTKKAVTGNSEAGASYAIQTQGGMKLSKHWSLEMGLSYLKGNSSYEGGGYVLSASSNRAANVVENALAGLQSGPAAGMATDKSQYFSNNGALYIDVAKTVSNNYHYLQLPVQAGFTLFPAKKLSYSLLGGMMANFFLSNELESASGEIIRTKASDEVYRSMNWAATTGLRFNYRLSTRWNANLTGSYQKSVTSGFRSNQSLDSRPYLYGVSWGMRYSF